MAATAEQIGVKKAHVNAVSMFVLAALAGAIIALGAVFVTTVVAGTAALPYGVVRFLAGLVFSLGLILVVVGGQSCSRATIWSSWPGPAGWSAPDC